MHTPVSYVKDFPHFRNAWQWRLPPPYNRLISAWKSACSSFALPVLLTSTRPLFRNAPPTKFYKIIQFVRIGLYFDACKNVSKASLLTADVLLSSYWIKKIERESLPIKQPGIILRIQAHPSTDPIGAFLPDHRTLYSLSHLSKNFAVISHTIKDQDLYGELARVVSAVSKLGAIKILTIEGHGSPQSITLNTGKEGKLSINGDPDPLKKAFKELPKDCKIILQSCSTGQGKENIAAYICAISQRTVFAPPASHIGYPDISYQQAPEHSKFQVTYWNGCSDFPASEFTFTG